MTQTSDRARVEQRHVGKTFAELAEWEAANNQSALATFERETPGFAAGVESDEIERDIRTALWNTGCWQGKPQVVAQSFIRHAMEEPCMIRALTAIRNRAYRSETNAE